MRRPSLKNLVAVGSVAAAVAAGTGFHTATAAPSDGTAFTACMRSHGVPDFPDVTLSSDGLINLDIQGEPVDVLSGKYGAAIEACESHLPSGTNLPDAPQAPPAPRFRN